MNIEKIILDKNFTNFVLSKVPKYLINCIEKDDLISELNLVILLCSKTFNPNRGRFINFVIVSLNNNLKNIYRKISIQQQYEKALVGDFEHIEQYDDNKKELLAFFKDIDTDILDKLTDFALGKIKKEDINCPPLKISNTQLQRIINRIDAMV